MIERMVEDFSGCSRPQRGRCCDISTQPAATPTARPANGTNPRRMSFRSLIEAAIKPGRVFTVNGTDFDTRDGTAVRDYIHVTDLAHAHVLGG